MTNKITIGNAKSTKAIMNRFGLHAKKGYGQNFLTDPSILQRIVEAANINRNDNVIEIGPGLGALTQQLATKAGSVLAIEIDQDLIPVLDNLFHEESRVKIMQGDVMKLDLGKLITDQFDDPNRPVKVVANLPYYITTPILMKLLNASVTWDCICVMMQKEVAERVTAHPDTKEYGALTLAVTARMDAKIAFGVSKRYFMPSPKVDSAIVLLTPRTVPISPQPADMDKMFTVIRGCFAHRRKNLRNNLRALIGKDSVKIDAAAKAIEPLGINLQQRPGELSLSQYSAMTNNLIQAKLI